MRRVGVVRELLRYPVKSMAGEALAAAEVARPGMAGDRAWAVSDEDNTRVKIDDSDVYRRLSDLVSAALPER